MSVKFQGIEKIGRPNDEVEDVSSNVSESFENNELIKTTIDSLIKTYIRFAPKDNEGQQALIFKYDLETNITNLSEEDRDAIESYIGETKSIKILKVTDKAAADSEYHWHKEAYRFYEEIPDEDKHKYAGIPQPYINHTLDIDEDTKKRLNSQNANISEKKASALVMEWIDGEDLLTQLLRKYLFHRPGYENTASDPLVNFQSLLIAVSGDFRTRGLDFNSMSTLEQYQRLFKDVSKNETILTPEQQIQVKNTLDLLHRNKIYHNDLHLRNFLVEEGTGKIYIIDFGRTGSSVRPTENDIKDEMILNFSREYSGDNIRKEAVLKSLNSDVDRIIQRDRTFESVLKAVETKHGTDLIQFLERESSQWRIDSWNVKKYIAIVRKLQQDNPDKSELIKNFMLDKKNNLNVECQELISLI